ncbi:SCP2 domain-containing protein [Thalassotalea aquiviva]|uniref:ubiquinone biosynthesis accessory factor UbiJ n=1 Tax=Thalassotalea aquiviva TaxID=3242415 RepID=UPI00352BAC06
MFSIAQLMPKQVLASVLEASINKALVLSTNASQLMAPLNGQALSIYLHELGFILSFRVQDQQVYVLSDNKAEECHIDTSLKVLPKLRQSSLLTQLIKTGQLDIEGDPKIAQQFAQVGEHLAIDWEQHLANNLGDVPAYKLTQLGKAAKQKLGIKQQQFSQDASEFLLHEQRLCVSNSELSVFNHSVKNLAQQVTELEQRIQSLCTQANKG